MLTILSVTMLGIFAFAQTPGNAKRAIGLVKSQCGGNQYNGQTATLDISSTALGICINGRTFEVYTVSVFYSCPPQLLTTCLPAPPEEVATVTFNCEGDITVQCLQ